MSKLLTTKGISFFCDELFKTSKEFVYLVSAYIKIDQILEERIIEAVDSGLRVVLIFGKDIKQVDTISPKLFQKIEILYYENLHAKFYMNEKLMLVTSMNLHSFSQLNNREIGVLFSNKDQNDKAVFEDGLKEFESIKKQSIKLDQNPKTVNSVEFRKALKPISNIEVDPNFSDEIKERVYNILAKDFQISKKEIELNSLLKRDYNLSSFTLMKLSIELEKEFKFIIPYEDVLTFKKIKDVLVVVEHSLKFNGWNQELITSYGKVDYVESQFIFYYKDYLSKKFSSNKFELDGHVIYSDEFPISGLDFSTYYGIGCFEVNVSDRQMREMLKRKNDILKHRHFVDYKLYWNKENIISIYPNSNIEYRNLGSQLDYYINGVSLLVAHLSFLLQTSSL